MCLHAVPSSCVHSTGHNDTHRLTIPLFSNMFITLPWISFQVEWWAGASCKQAHAQLLHTFSMQDSSTHRAQTNTSHRQGRGKKKKKKKSVSPEQRAPWSTLDLRLSSKDRISVRLRSESKGKGSMGRGDDFYPIHHEIRSSSGRGNKKEIERIRVFSITRNKGEKKPDCIWADWSDLGGSQVQYGKPLSTSPQVSPSSCVLNKKDQQ